MKRFIYIALSVLLISLVFIYNLINLTSSDLQEMILIPIFKNVVNVSMFLFFILVFLRLRDILIKHEFSIKEIKENLGIAIYYSLSFFSVAIGIAMVMSFN